MTEKATQHQGFHVKQTPPVVLCVNPWIDDFAAYDFWAKPLGLAWLAAILRRAGCTVHLVDFLHDPSPDPLRRAERERRFGRGPFQKRPIEKPALFSDVPRRYSRYGRSKQDIEPVLRRVGRPDIVLVTCAMTYWYPGAFEAILFVRSVYGADVPVWLGGGYAQLCAGHAREYSPADRVIPFADPEKCAKEVLYALGMNEYGGFSFQDPSTWPDPAWDLYEGLGYIPVLTSTGCPYGCGYCASGLLWPDFIRRDPVEAARAVARIHFKTGIRDFVFYDDALLVDQENHAARLFESIASSGLPLRFHTPNAVHVRGITPGIASLMKRIGMKTIRLGLETAGAARRYDKKVCEGEFERAAAYLREAGFSREEVGVYLLFGLPGQAVESVEESIRLVRKEGFLPIIAYYSPIPKTRLWDAACAASRYDLAADPLFTNNAVLPCLPEFDWNTITRLKLLARGQTP